MANDDQKVFRRYLEAIPDELLAEVAEDCAWLSAALAGDGCAAGYRDRLALCRQESARRRMGGPAPFGLTAPGLSF